MESLNNFNFDEWRQRYNDWIRAKKLRVTDFFRKQDVQGYGTLTRNQFVNGMIGSSLCCNRYLDNMIGLCSITFPFVVNVLGLT